MKYKTQSQQLYLEQTDFYVNLWWEKVAVEDSFGVEGRHNVAVSLVDGHQEVREQTFVEAEFSTFLPRISSHAQSVYV